MGRVHPLGAHVAEEHPGGQRQGVVEGGARGLVGRRGAAVGGRQWRRLGRGGEREGPDAFVELLLKTSEVSASTTYEDAKNLLVSSQDWHAVDEATRKECFGIFVEHLGTHPR